MTQTSHRKLLTTRRLVRRIALWTPLLCGYGIAEEDRTADAQGFAATLLEDDFGSLRPGILTGVVGAHTEYHYLPEAASKGNWAVSTFRSDPATQRAWRVIERNGSAAMQQAIQNKEFHYHPMVIAGDDLWSDYRFSVELAPQGGEGQCGVVFRYRNDRCYYFFGLNGQNAVLKSVQHATAYRQPQEQVLAEQICRWAPDDCLRATIEVKGVQIRAQLAKCEAIESPIVELAAQDAIYPRGKVGLTADFPTTFQHVNVATDSKTLVEIDQAIAQRRHEELELQSQHPQPVVWRKVMTPDVGVGRNLRFGDLDGDGATDVLMGQVNHHGPKDRNSELSCLTAMTFDGRKLWQIGAPDPWRNHLTCDVAFQIHDWDGDGRNEVVYAMGMEILVADGATGKTLRKVPTPATPPRTKPPYNRFPRILGDSLFFCDLRGVGRPTDLVIKDRYASLWALDEKLQVLWHARCNTGHYPFAADIDDDGKDELMAGYTLFDHDGAVLWSLDNSVQDHADGVALVRFRSPGPYRLLCAASDEGMFFADIHGQIVKHHYLGHVQNPAVADFRPDLPGLESISINFWGNQGIVHFYDANGDIYHDAELCQHGSMCLPTNWTGKPGELFVLSADVRQGGLFDGWGRRAVEFPADGHPDMCNAVLDITGDCRDEIVVWDPYEIWVYTQSDSPLPGRLYKPQRNPQHNNSNYQATVSLPAWSE